MKALKQQHGVMDSQYEWVSNMNAKTIKWLFLLLTMISCQNQLEDRYLSPDKNESPTIDKLFTRMLDDNRVRPSYWEVSTIVNWHIGIYSQTVGYLNNEFVYQQNDQYVQERWNDFYRPSSNGAGVVAHYREMEKIFNTLSETDKDQWRIFMEAGKIILSDHAADMVDLWGDIPFSQAGLLNETGAVVYPDFDEDSKVYAQIITDLAVATEFLATHSMTDAVKSLFAQQDILLHGNTQMWQRYGNALRLRLLMRTSNVDEATARVQVLDMLSDPKKYPLSTGDQYEPGVNDVLLSPLTTYTDDLHAAFTDWTNYPAPYYLLEKVMKPVDDPRIPVMFDKYGLSAGTTFIANDDYRAMPWNADRIQQQSNLGNYAILDSVTFLLNSQLPGVVMTVAEVDFLKAEVFERWGGGDAALAYEQGLRHSISFYFHLNHLNTFASRKLSPPSEQTITTFLQRPGVHYGGSQSDRLNLIYTQKWAHFSFLQSIDAWSELRRTNQPEIEFLPAPLSGFELPPSRLDYPTSEKTFNPNYTKVKGKDRRTGKIFWDID
ncbi:MAG: SusD/RagB family nutrient-binding outer membrane lipoprotein [Chryseolinea sp.]